MKIAMLLDQIIYPQVINPKTEQRFLELGEVSFNRTRENDLETRKRF